VCVCEEMSEEVCGEHVSVGGYRRRREGGWMFVFEHVSVFESVRW
jgi:hypothetical protein